MKGGVLMIKKQTHIPLYTLNNFLKFDRKLYQVFGLSLGRPIAFKSIIYALVIGVIEFIIYITPVIGNLINWLPFIVLVMIPIGLSWLLTDIGTEDRSPSSFFKSFILYQIRRFKKDSYFRGRIVPKERIYSFNNYIMCQKSSVLINAEEIEAERMAEAERKKALRYMERIRNPDDFFERLRQEKARRQKRRWFFF